MRTKFKENFLVVDRGVFNAYRYKSIWQEESKIIMGMDFAKQEDILESLKGTFLGFNRGRRGPQIRWSRQ